MERLSGWVVWEGKPHGHGGNPWEKGAEGITFHPSGDFLSSAHLQGARSSFLTSHQQCVPTLFLVHSHHAFPSVPLLGSEKVMI